MSRRTRRRKKKLEDKKVPRFLLHVVAWERPGGGSHGDSRKAKSREECRKWKRNKRHRIEYDG